jgi:hypothetical protein
MADGWTIDEAVEALHPPIPRRELARLMEDVRPLRYRWGRPGRRPAVYPVDALMTAHADWVDRHHD